MAIFPEIWGFTPILLKIAFFDDFGAF